MEVVSTQSQRMFSRISHIWLSAVATKPHDRVCVLYVPGVALARNVAAATLSSPPSPQPTPTTTATAAIAQCWVMSDSRGCWMLKESATAAGGRDKAPPYLHRLNSRINLSTPPLPPWCLSPPYLSPPPPFLLQHLPPYICTVVMMWEIAF